MNEERRLIITPKRQSDISTIMDHVILGNVGTVGITSGVFDLYHRLHLLYLEQCAAHCDFLVVGIDADELVREFKGPNRPIVPQHDRAELIAATHCVHAAFIMHSVADFDAMCEALVSRTKKLRVFKNQNFKPGDITICARGAAEFFGIPDQPVRRSTTEYIEAIVAGGKKPQT